MKKSCVVCHLYYYSLVDELFKKIEEICKILRCDIFFTLPYENRPFFYFIKNKFKNARIFFYENIGFDIYPFMMVLKEIDLNSYEFVFKLHTKKDIPIFYTLNGYDLTGSKWRDNLLNPICGDRISIVKCLTILKLNPYVGMIGSNHLIVRGKKNIEKDIDLKQVLFYLNRLKLNSNCLEYIAGSMFIVRSFLLDVLKKSNFEKKEYGKYFPRDWNALPYCLERIFGFIVSSQGYYLAGV